MPYRIEEVDGSDPNVAAILHRFNAMAPEIFPVLENRHLENGFWFLALDGTEVVAFAGMVPMEPFDGVMYIKRCFVAPEARHRGLQLLLLTNREERARRLGMKMLVSECGPNNHASASSFRKAQFEIINPEQKWAGPNDLYWRKVLV